MTPTNADRAGFDLNGRVHIVALWVHTTLESARRASGRVAEEGILSGQRVLIAEREPPRNDYLVMLRGALDRLDETNERRPA